MTMKRANITKTVLRKPNEKQTYGVSNPLVPVQLSLNHL